MAFKFKTFAAVGALIGSLALVGCGQDEKDPNHIKVGVIVGAEQQVAEVAQKVAKEKYGLDVELVTFNDYVLPNEALSKGDIDANAFQHKPYLVIGNAGQHNAPDGIRIPFSVFVRSVCRGIHDGSGHFYVTVLRVIMGNVFPLKTFDDLLGNDGLSFTDAVGIFFHLEILVDDHNAAFIQIGQHLQFRIDDFSGIAGVLSDTMAA